MDSGPPLDPDEILLRRIPAPLDRNSKLLEDGSRRPNSNCMAPREDSKTRRIEEALSCSRLRYTSPKSLLDQLQMLPTPIDPTGWSVCWFRVSDLVKIEDGDRGLLEVHPDPTELDPGHCGIHGPDGSPCPRTRATSRHLAKIARILTPEQVANIQPGDHLELT